MKTHKRTTSQFDLTRTFVLKLFQIRELWVRPPLSGWHSTLRAAWYARYARRACLFYIPRYGVVFVNSTEVYSFIQCNDARISSTFLLIVHSCKIKQLPCPTRLYLGPGSSSHIYDIDRVGLHFVHTVKCRAEKRFFMFPAKLEAKALNSTFGKFSLVSSRYASTYLPSEKLWVHHSYAASVFSLSPRIALIHPSTHPSYVRHFTGRPLSLPENPQRPLFGMETPEKCHLWMQKEAFWDWKVLRHRWQQRRLRWLYTVAKVRNLDKIR